ncbi:MAG TPA: EcsC family protein [Pirellulales bacterium]|nr:EcsC family protein [Pirellulales bacterium]
MSDDYLSNAKHDIRQWEHEGPSWLAQVGNLIFWPATKVAEQLIPDGVQEAVGKAIEAFLIGIGNLSNVTFDAAHVRERVATELATFGESCDMWEQLAAADRGAQHYWNWNLSYAAAEGCAAGAVGIIGLAADIPALLTIAIRLIQQVSVCYGYDPTKPEERDYVIHVLRTASAGDIEAKLEAVIFLKQIEEILLKVAWKKMNAAFAAKKISSLSLLAAVKQFAKSLGINLTKRKALQMVPIIGAVVGASFNATFINDIGRTAFMSYRRRWIAEREPPDGPVPANETSNPPPDFPGHSGAQADQRSTGDAEP